MVHFAPYFFASYGLGALAYWAGQGCRPAIHGQRLVAALALVALLVDFRWRILVALVTVMMINLSHLSLTLTRWQPSRLMAYLGRTSYALFLLHVPVYVLVTSLFCAFEISGPYASFIGMLLTWAAALWIAGVFQRRIEAPLARLRIPGPLQLQVDAAAARKLGLSSS